MPSIDLKDAEGMKALAHFTPEEWETVKKRLKELVKLAIEVQQELDQL